MLSFLNKHGHNVHSQNNEDGVIAEVCRRLNLTEGHCVEIGANDGLWLSNTRHLIEQGWSGKFVETEWLLYLKCAANWAHRPDVNAICSRVDDHNVNAFVSDDCDLLSIDTDGHDFEIFRGLRARPKIVIVEIDSSIEPPDERVEETATCGVASFTAISLLSCHVAGELRLVQFIRAHEFKDGEVGGSMEWLECVHCQLITFQLAP